MIQFPTGPPNDLPRLTVEDLGSLSIPPATGYSPQTAEAPADILELGKAATAALAIEGLQSWPDQPSRAAGAAEYQLALTAVEHGDHAASVQHLQQAILAQPIHAEAARQDPAFEAIRGPVQDLVGRLSVLARMQAEASIAEAEATIESARESDALPRPVVAAATPDPAFDTIQTPMWELVNRLTPPPRPGAQTLAAERAPASEIQPPEGQSARSSLAVLGDLVRTATLTRTSDSAQPKDVAQAYFDMARAHFELGTYAGYVVAAQAATLAHQTAAYSKVARLSKHPAIPDGACERGLLPLGRALRQATRRLWERLPLLAILLGWFFAGVLFGVASLPFQQAGTAGIRGMLFPIWALGLVGIVLIGFVRSIRRIRTRHPRL